MGQERFDARAPTLPRTRLRAGAFVAMLALAAPAGAEPLRGGLTGATPDAPVAVVDGPFPEPPPMRGASGETGPAVTGLRTGMAGADDTPASRTASLAAPPALRGEVDAGGAARRSVPSRTPSPPPAIREEASLARIASTARSSSDALPGVRATLRTTGPSVGTPLQLPPSLATRAIPHGERLPAMRGPLARSLVLGELRRASRPTSRSTSRAPALGDIVGSIGEDGATPAGTTGGASVGDSVRAALVVDDGLRASLARADAASFAVGRARGAMLPKVTLEGTAGSRSPLAAWEEATYRTARAVLTIPVFASGANIAAMRAARASSDAAALAHLAEERVAVLEAATAHLDLHAAIAVERALAANARGMVETLAASRALFEAGEASLADVAVAEANLESARGELASGRQSLDRARVEYRVRTGRRAPRDPRAPDTDGLVPKDVERAVRAAMRGPDVAVGFARADAARHDARAELGRAGPRVDLTASYGHRVDAIEEPDGAYDASLGVRLSVPIIDFETVPGVRAARARARASEYAARDAARDVERRVRNAHAAHAGAMAREAAARRREGALTRALEATRSEYRAGFRTVTDVVRARVGLARARIDLANATRDRHRAAYTVGVMTGHVAPGR